MDLLEAAKTLDAFIDLKVRAVRPQTFMDIAGRSRSENMCSNVLRFFLDPKEPHGLGTLVLDALLDAGGISKAKLTGNDIVVEREVITTNGNRIDLLIQTGEHVIAIENKIDARFDNPVEDYEDFVRRRYPMLEPKLILLSLKPVYAGERWHNLRYGKLVTQIRLGLGKYASEADTRYLTLFLDFLKTLENLSKGTRMDQRPVDFLATRHGEVEKLLNQVSEVKEMKSKTKELRDLIDITSYEGVTQHFERPAAYLYDDLIHDVPISKSLIVRVETSLFPQGWEIWIHPLVGEYEDLINLLQELEIPFEEDEEYGGVHHRDNFVHKYNEDPDGIRELLQQLIDKLATAEAKNR